MSPEEFEEIEESEDSEMEHTPEKKIHKVMYVKKKSGNKKAKPRRNLTRADRSKLKKRVKKLERTVDWIGNYVEEQTGLEAGKELTDSFESSSTDEMIEETTKK